MNHHRTILGLVSILLVTALYLDPVKAQAMDFDSQRLLKLSLGYAQKGQMSRALKGFREINQKYPGNPIIEFNLGNSAFMLGKYKLAIIYYTKVHRSTSPLKYPARIYLVRALAKVSLFKRSYALLKKLRPKKGLDALKDELKVSREILHDEIILSGIEDFQKRNFKEASIKFRSANGIFNSGESLYLLGLSERRRGLSKRSRYFLKKARRRYGANDNLEDIDSIISNIENSQKRYGNRLQLTLEQNHDSNFFTEKDDPSRVNGQSLLASFSHYNQTSKGLLYAGVASLTGDFYTQLENQDYGDLDLRGPVVIPLGLVDLNVTPKLNFSWFDSNPYSLRTGLSSQVVRNFTQASLGFIFNYDLVNSQKSEFSYIDGRELFIGTSLKVPAKVTAYFQGGYRDTDAGNFIGTDFEIPQAYDGFEFSASASYTLSSTFISTGASFSFYRFKANFLPENKVRRDKNIGFYTIIDVRLKDELFVSFNMSYRDRSSTMVSSVGIDSNFVQWKYGASLNWGIDL